MTNSILKAASLSHLTSVLATLFLLGCSQGGDHTSESASSTNPLENNNSVTDTYSPSPLPDHVTSNVEAFGAISQNNPKECFYLAPAQPTLEQSTGRHVMAPNKGAVGISMKDGAIIAHYPDKAGLKGKIRNANSHADLARILMSADIKDFTEVGNKIIAKSPLDFNVDKNSVTAFILFEDKWFFRDEGFLLDTKLSNKPGDRFSPFNEVVDFYPTRNQKKVVMVEFDRHQDVGQRTPSKNCLYKYDLPIVIRSGNGKYETKIIIDPGIGNNGGPPPGQN